MASLKNAVVRLRNLTARMGDAAGKKDLNVKGDKSTRKGGKRSRGAPLLACSVPQLQVDLLAPT